jgi:hypothetical protein
VVANSYNQPFLDGSIVSLNGQHSSSPNNVPITLYDWVKVNSNSNSSLSFSNGHSAQPMFKAPNVASPTKYTFRLVVTDYYGYSSTTPDEVSIMVNNLPN